MSDYTLDELQEMMTNKLLEEADNGDDPLTLFIESCSLQSDTEKEKVTDNGVVTGFIFKSKTADKHYVEQRHYINETENGQVVGRSVSYRTFTTGSYNDTLARPLLQVIRERPIDRTVLKG